jgi:enamine deaminase RidA (YjgF/YER057c/UK114 family)
MASSSSATTIPHPETSTPLLITTYKIPGKHHPIPQSDISIVPFPPTNPIMSFIRTSPQNALRAPDNNPGMMPRPFRNQARLAFLNLGDALALGGATAQDVTKLTVYLAEGSGSVEKMVQLGDAMRVFFGDESKGKGFVHRPVVAVFKGLVLSEGFGKIEVEAEAVARVVVAVPPPRYEEAWEE